MSAARAARAPARKKAPLPNGVPHATAPAGKEHPAHAVRRFSTTGACQKCRGTGKIIKTPCSACHGSGFERKTRQIKINIPAGIDEQQTISLRGEGSHSQSHGQNGDVYVVVSIKPHTIFTRQGTDIVIEMPVTFVQAALGAELTVPTIDGKVKYSIPEGTQSGTVFRIKGRGIPVLNSKSRGDQYVKINVEIPNNLSAAAKRNPGKI